MPAPTPFRAYGENSATFLIFQALAMKSGALADVFLANLKNFGDGKKFRGEKLTEPEIWLFPNFGKGSGFGEPDVLILAGKYVFWIEVETTINCQKRLPSLRNTLLQLWRFRLFQDALSRSAKARLGSRRIVGRTLSNNHIERPAEVRLKGHGVLQAIRNKLKKASEDGRHHYVLFTVNKPKGEGGDGRPYAKVLADELQGLGDGYRKALPRLDAKHCWYAYWHGDIESTFNDAEGPRLILSDSYVRIKKS